MLFQLAMKNVDGHSDADPLLLNWLCLNQKIFPVHAIAALELLLPLTSRWTKLSDELIVAWCPIN